MKSSKTNTWQNELMDAICDPKELLDILNLDANLLSAAKAAANVFSLKVPRGFVARMKKNDINDPLLMQILPLHAELQPQPGYKQDPLAEKNVNPHPGLLHKYSGRVLLTFSSVCGVNCRYCFRRHFPYDENNPGTKGLQTVLEYIKNDATISEIILSGGDPLIVSDARFAEFTQKIAEIPHISRLRIHSRTPVVLPSRITSDFIAAITHPRLSTVLVMHCNHPQELNYEVEAAMQKLADAKIKLLNQSVLLKGINDNEFVLKNLSEQLFAMNVMPYYLHLLDKVQGAAHFDVEKNEALRIYRALSAVLPGYLVPKLVCEQPGALAKTILGTEE